jgi:hypothetical protein
MERLVATAIDITIQNQCPHTRHATPLDLDGYVHYEIITLKLTCI